jgi:ribosomal protein S18 acetylase RimI-like enzyme
MTRSISDALRSVCPPSHGLGRKFATIVINVTRKVGCERVRLDTFGSMKAAMRLYESLGFQRSAPYRDNPGGCAVFLGLKLFLPGH